MPVLSHEEGIVRIGSTWSVVRNECDPCLFLRTALSLSHPPIATSKKTFTATLLVDSRATHDVLGMSAALKAGVLEDTVCTEREVSGFDGTKSQASHEIDLFMDNDPYTTRFIITKIKDTYDGILGMPWLKRFGHLVDWTTNTIDTRGTHNAAAEAVLSKPTTPSSSPWMEPTREARQTDEGTGV